MLGGYHAEYVCITGFADDVNPRLHYEYKYPGVGYGTGGDPEHEQDHPGPGRPGMGVSGTRQVGGIRSVLEC